MLTLAQKTLVQETFAAVAPIADDVAALFYRRLFEIDPSLQEMFRGNMAEQRKKLMQMLTAAVKGLDHLEQLVPAVQGHGGLGRAAGGWRSCDRMRFVRRDSTIPPRQRRAMSGAKSAGFAASS